MTVTQSYGATAVASSSRCSAINWVQVASSWSLPQHCFSRIKLQSCHPVQ
jgi:hypothetical protein